MEPSAVHIGILERIALRHSIQTLSLIHISRPESGYKQFYLKGRNLRVGQLIFKMRANGLTDEEAAVDMSLPIAQVREAQVYYQINRELIEQESARENEQLNAAGVAREPGDLPG